MKNTIASVLAVSALAAAAPAFSQVSFGVIYDSDPYYDPYVATYDGRYAYDDRYGYRGYSQWQNINQRQRNLDRRIDMGVRNGTLTRAEAVRLRAEFRQLARLEARYRRTGSGLNGWERADLDRRFDRLSAQIRWERRDQQYRGYRRW